MALEFGGEQITPPDFGNESASPIPERPLKLSVKNLVNITTDVNDWYMMGVQVDIEPAVLKRIEEKDPAVEKRKLHMFEHWLSTDETASWDKLATALDNMHKYKLLATRIRNIHRAYSASGASKASFYSVYTTDSGYWPSSVPATPGLDRTEAEVSLFADRCITGYQSTTDRPMKSNRIDTNIVSIKFGILADAKQVHTGDPVVCGNSECTAVLNSYSVVDEGEKVWKCELCATSNAVDLATEEIPLKSDVLYATKIGSSQKGRGSLVGEQPRDAVVVFCIDTSGSMCQTTEVPGKFVVKGNDQLYRQRLFEQFAEGESQFLPHKKRDVSYVSRMQSVQAAVDNEVTTIFSKDPKQRVALVAFNSEVTIVGDGILDEVTIAGDRLSSYEALMKIGSELPIPSRIGQVRQHLGDKLFSLQEKGQTALGPALLISVMLAGKAPGSKVIVCTDGKANRGLGQLENLKDTAQAESTATFYTDVGTLARHKSVTVSILTMKGTETGLLDFGKVSTMTGGKVNIVDPLSIEDEFSNILSTPVIATGVTAKLIMHKDIYISSTNDSVLKVPVGNVTASTELSYTFHFREGLTPQVSNVGGASVNASSTTPLSVGGVPHLPFQVQISYTAPNGSSYLRVVTSTRPLAKTYNEAIKGANAMVLTNFVRRTASRFSMDNKPEEAATICRTHSYTMRETGHPEEASALLRLADHVCLSKENDEAALAVLMMPTSTTNSTKTNNQTDVDNSDGIDGESKEGEGASNSAVKNSEEKMDKGETTEEKQRGIADKQEDGPCDEGNRAIPNVI